VSANLDLFITHLNPLSQGPKKTISASFGTWFKKTCNDPMISFIFLSFFHFSPYFTYFSQIKTAGLAGGFH